MEDFEMTGGKQIIVKYRFDLAFFYSVRLRMLSD